MRWPAALAVMPADRLMPSRVPPVPAGRIRLTEFRHAAAQVAIIGEYYKLRARSTRATYGGILCTLIGIAAILIAFTWPMTSAGH